MFGISHFDYGNNNDFNVLRSIALVVGTTKIFLDVSLHLPNTRYRKESSRTVQGKVTYAPYIGKLIKYPEGNEPLDTRYYLIPIVTFGLIAICPSKLSIHNGLGC